MYDRMLCDNDMSIKQAISYPLTTPTIFMFAIFLQFRRGQKAIVGIYTEKLRHIVSYLYRHCLHYVRCSWAHLQRIQSPNEGLYPDAHRRQRRRPRPPKSPLPCEGLQAWSLPSFHQELSGRAGIFTIALHKIILLQLSRLKTKGQNRYLFVFKMWCIKMACDQSVTFSCSS